MESLPDGSVLAMEVCSNRRHKSIAHEEPYNCPLCEALDTIDELEGKVAGLEKELDAMTAERDDYKERLEEAEQKLTSVERLLEIANRRE